MLAAVFFVTVVVVLTGHYLLVERPRRVAGESATGRRPLPLRDLVSRLPTGVFLQPTFTWSQVRPAGDVEMGVHPLLLSLLGTDAELELRGSGEHVDKGDPLITVGSGERRLVLRSPITGSITAARQVATRDADWSGVLSGRGAWTYLLRPEDLSGEVPEWMIGQAAVDWTRTQYGRIRDHLLERSADVHTGLALADGGELPVGALRQLDADDWVAFQDEFLSSCH